MNRVAFDLGFIQIYWYSICIIVGMAVGIMFVYREAARKKVSENLLTDLIFNTVIISIIGARLYYVAFNLEYYMKNILEIFEIWNGGLAIHGGILFGTLYLVYYTKKHNMGTSKIMDICAVGLIIGQIFGRWGNFFNGEAYGPICSLEFLKSFHLPKFIIDGMYIDGFYRQPTFLYESLWNLVGLIIMLVIRRFRYIKEGQVTGFYLMWYSLGRFCIESLRTDSLMFGDIRIAQLVSLVMFLLGLFFMVRRIKTSKFEYLYNSGDDNG